MTSLAPPARSARAWLAATRPATLPAAVVPVLVGSAAAYSQGYLHRGALSAALLASLLIQIGTNFANDYFDHVHGADAHGRQGPVRLIQSRRASPGQVLVAALSAFALAAILGLYLVYVGGWPILIIGVLAILSGIAYTGGPYPLGYHGLGDVFVFLFFGVIAVTGTYYLHTGAVSALAWWASVPVGLLVTNILVVNNVRDIHTDMAAGKRTLATRIGDRASRRQYAAFMLASFLVPPVLWACGLTSAWVWLTWLALPIAYAAGRAALVERTGPRLNHLLRTTGRLHMLFGLLFAVGLVL